MDFKEIFSSNILLLISYTFIVCFSANIYFVIPFFQYDIGIMQGPEPIKIVFVNDSSQFIFPFERIYSFDSHDSFEKPINNVQDGLQFYNFSDYNYSLFRVNDTFVGSAGNMIKNGVLYTTSSFYNGHAESISMGFTWLGIKERVLMLSHVGTPIFGHFFMDFLSPLMLIPKEYYQDCVFPFVLNLRFYMKSCFRLFGIPEKNVLIYSQQEFIYYRTVFFLNPYPHYFVCNRAYFVLSQRLREYLKLPNTPPTKYLFSSRKRESRGISNIDEIVQNIAMLYPSIDIQKVPFYKNLEKNARVFNNAKLFFCGFHGSGFANLFFMRNGTTFIEIQTYENFRSALNICSSLGVNYFYSTMSHIMHFNKSNHYVPQSVYLPLLTKAINFSMQNK